MSMALGAVLAASSAHAQANCASITGTATYTYDALGRLTGTCNTGNGVQATYTYDSAGNRTSQSVVLYPLANPVTVIVKAGVATTIYSNITPETATGVGIVSGSGPSNGAVSVSGNNFVYTPGSGVGATTPASDSFQYTASQGSWTSPPATVSITIMAPPIAGAVTQTVAANSQSNPVLTTNINLTSMITGGPPTSVAIASGPSHGTVSISGLHMFYTPANGYPATGNSAPDSFTYTASNSVGTSAPATVTITVAWGFGIWCPASNPNLFVPGCFAWGSGVLW